MSEMCQYVSSSNTRTFYRNLCSGVLPPLKNLDRDTIFMLLDLIESPAAFPERIFERIRQRKAYVEEIKQLKCSSDAAVSKGFKKIIFLFYFYLTCTF